MLKQKRALATKMLKAVHAQESLEASAAKAEEVAAKLDEMRLKEAAKVVREGFLETLTYTHFPLGDVPERLKTRNQAKDPRSGHLSRRRGLGKGHGGKGA